MSKSIPFTKMQALGNDFIVIDCRDVDYRKHIADYKTICDRKLGIGCDQLIFIDHPQSKDAYISVDMYNADGSLTGACGNGTRCIALYINQSTGKKNIVIESLGNMLICDVMEDQTVDVNMGYIKTNWQDIPLSQNYAWNDIPMFNGIPVKGYVVNIGNPHIVFVVDNIRDINVETMGAYIENHPLFPQKVNVEFVEIQKDNNVRMRVWERGVGVTQACGTGACAVGFVVHTADYVESKEIIVHMDGGSLVIKNSEEGVHMCGEAQYVFKGEFL